MTGWFELNKSSDGQYRFLHYDGKYRARTISGSGRIR